MPETCNFIKTCYFINLGEKRESFYHRPILSYSLFLKCRPNHQLAIYLDYKTKQLLVIDCHRFNNSTVCAWCVK